MDDFITSYLLKTCLIKLLPRHNKFETCNCNGWVISLADRTPECKWVATDSGSACGWASRIYEKLKTQLEAKKTETWYNEYRTLVDCTHCKVERGCCKKKTLTLAMTSQILEWLKQHQTELDSIDMFTGETRVPSQQHNSGSIDSSAASEMTSTQTNDDALTAGESSGQV